jgi:large subunit ribosomal protein L4
MNLDVVNDQNEKVGALEISDELLAGRTPVHLIWESVVCRNAGTRRGTHATKTRAEVSGSGKKPWRQKGTGRARVGEIRNPLWRKGGVVFGPQPRSYAYQLPRKVERGALRAAFVSKVNEGALVVVDELAAADGKTKAAAEMLARLGAAPRTLLLDVKPDEKLARAVRNLKGVRLVPSGRVTARDLASAARVIASRRAVERLQEVLSGSVTA